MSKFVKNLVSDDIKTRYQKVNDALLVNMVGLNSSSTYSLRKGFRAGSGILVVKNSQAVRATSGTSLARLFDGVGGSAAICWGGEDIVALAKSITEILKSEKFRVQDPRGCHGRGADLRRSGCRGRHMAQSDGRTEPPAGPDSLGRLAIERLVDCG